MKKSNRRIDWQVVIQGRSNAEQVEIKEGLRAGEIILLRPPNFSLH